MATLTLQPDATAGKDSFIQADSADFNNGTSVQIQSIRTSGSATRRGVLEFDISSIPAGATVSSATLTLWTESVPSSGNETCAIHRITASWTEAGVTWNSRNGTNNWTSAGGDFDATADATFMPATLDNSVDVTITALVQEWVNGTSNLGMVIKHDAETGTSVGGIFHSSDAAGGDAGFRPKLVVEYSLGGGQPSYGTFM